jgi:hypothetical protein
MVRAASAQEQATLDESARAVIALCRLHAVDLEPLERFAPFHEVITTLSLVAVTFVGAVTTERDLGKAREMVRQTWTALRPKYPLLAEAVDALEHPSPTEESLCPPLVLDPEDNPELIARLAAEASPWLDAYIAWSRKWAPRAFEEFHEAGGLFVLSTTAARRVRLAFGHGVYTSLYMALAARTTLYTKSTAASLAIFLLHRAGLWPLLAPDDATPQAFIRSMAGYIPEGYDEFTRDERETTVQRLRFAAQRGWFYEEFGQHLAAMMQRDGVMAAFRGLLRRFDDHPEGYSLETIGRGAERLVKPYLTLLANITPADLKPFATANSPLWRDGYLARFGFIAPAADDRRTDEFPRDQLTAPPELLKRLQQWHQRLGVPEVSIEPITDKKDQPTGRYRIRRGPVPELTYQLSEGVWQAYYRYDKALLALASQAANQDLDGSYGRLANKALRIAGLLASMEDDDHTKILQLRHWYRGQQIAERWRAALHRLITQLDEDVTQSRAAKVEGQIMRIVKKHGALSVREIGQRTGIPHGEVLKMIDALQQAGVFEMVNTSHTTKYRYRYESLNGDDPSKPYTV